MSQQVTGDARPEVTLDQRTRVPHVRGCVCLTVDRLRFASVASIFACLVVAWVSQKSPAKQTRWLCFFADLLRLGPDPHGADRTTQQTARRQIRLYAELVGLGPGATYLQSTNVWFSLLAGDPCPPWAVLATQATNRHTKSRQHSREHVRWIILRLERSCVPRHLSCEAS